MKNRRQKPTAAIPNRCPKCGGWLNPRTGYPRAIEWTCINCGLTSESENFVDFLNHKRGKG